ncbi:MAG: type II toxin-antitoxin system VapC family toxin [Chloroflexota bacterium]
MIIRDALQNITQIGIDTAPLIYFVEKHPVYFDRIKTVIQHITQGSSAGVSAALTLTEVLTQPIKIGRTDLVNEYEDILLNSAGFLLVATDAKIARVAAELRARYNLKTPDAIQVATALESGCQAFLTNDFGIKRVTELRILVLDDLELDPLS